MAIKKGCVDNRIWVFDKYNNPIKKRCSVCGEFKSIRDFGVRSSFSFGINYTCKECIRINDKLKYNTYRRYLNTTFNNMRKRCLNKNNEYYYNYGGRGISICKEWINCFDNFFEWAINHPTYSHGFHIDRIDNDGNYDPNNCEFVTRTKNNRKQSQNKLSMEIAKELRMDYNNGLAPKEISNKYNVSISLVNKMNNPRYLSYRSWRSDEWLSSNEKKDGLMK